jgi:hypothetical protein
MNNVIKCLNTRRISLYKAFYLKNLTNLNKLNSFLSVNSVSYNTSSIYNDDVKFGAGSNYAEIDKKIKNKDSTHENVIENENDTFGTLTNALNDM